MFRKSFGFTLAEVLITLGIIGVVAAMTIPTLMNKTQNEEMVTGLKKAYSILSQATLSLINENGDYSGWAPVDGTNAGVNDFYNLYKPYLSVVKDCGNDTDGCWAQSKNLAGANTGNSYGFGTQTKNFVLSDGMNVSIDIYSPIVSLNGVNTNSSLSIVQFAVDVNGNKKPNTLGKDVYLFVLTQYGLFPAGKDNNSSGCSTGSLGGNCAARVLNEGAINY